MQEKVEIITNHIVHFWTILDKNTQKQILCAGAKCDHFKLVVRTRVRAHLNLDVRGACVRPKKRSQLTP